MGVIKKVVAWIKGLSQSWGSARQVFPCWYRSQTTWTRQHQAERRETRDW